MLLGFSAISVSEAQSFIAQLVLDILKKYLSNTMDELIYARQILLVMNMS